MMMVSRTLSKSTLLISTILTLISTVLILLLAQASGVNKDHGYHNSNDDDDNNYDNNEASSSLHTEYPYIYNSTRSCNNPIFCEQSFQLSSSYCKWAGVENTDNTGEKFHVHALDKDGHHQHRQQHHRQQQQQQQQTGFLCELQIIGDGSVQCHLPCYVIDPWSVEIKQRILSTRANSQEWTRRKTLNENIPIFTHDDNDGGGDGGDDDDNDDNSNTNNYDYASMNDSEKGKEIEIDKELSNIQQQQQDVENTKEERTLIVKIFIVIGIIMGVLWLCCFVLLEVGLQIHHNYIYNSNTNNNDNDDDDDNNNNNDMMMTMIKQNDSLDPVNAELC